MAITMFIGSAAADLLGNPGFETWHNDSTPHTWRVEQRSRTTVQHERDTVRSGTSSCRLVRLIAGTGDNKGLLQRVPVQAGQCYAYAFWCRDDSPDISAGIGVSWRDADSGYIRTTGIKNSRDSTGWQLVRDSATAPAGAAFADIIIRTYGAASAPAGRRVICDDASFGVSSQLPETTRLWFVQDSLASRIIDFFDAATASIDYCCYNSSRPDVTLALINARNRGVRIRVITDNTRLGNSWVAYLRGFGIPVWSDSIGPGASNYMHNKFALRDLADSDTTNDWLWNASYNPNENETHADYAIELPNSAIARAYRLEFNQMWGDTGMTPDPARARFHTGKTDVLPTHDYTVGGYPCRLFFSPQNRVVDTISAVAASCQRELAFAINSFTHNGLGSMMLDLHNSGRRVFGTFDRANVGDPASEFHLLRPAGVPVLIDSVPFGNGTLHEKLMVIDSTITICGSANWSNNANVSNDENTLVLYDPGLARRFHAEIVTRYTEAGGTYPPAINEPATRMDRAATTRLPSPRTTRPIDMPIFDAAGRRVSASSGPGVFFAMDPNGVVTSFLVVR